MQAIQVADLKSHFSDVLKSVQRDGEIFIVEYGKRHEKVAMLIPYDKNINMLSERKFGIMQKRGSFEMKKDFSISEEEFLGL